MELIRRTAHARAGLVGNPSDGYNGKTISVIVDQFAARVTMYEWDQLEIVWSQEDRSRFRSIRELAQDVRLHGYYGGIRLVKAAIRKFVEYCISRGHRLHDRNFSVRYESDIPRQVGLAGSSAIIVATLRCLMDFYHVEIPLEVQPSLVLSVETEELGIAAGLQDRVIQVYEGLVYMDFAKDRMQRHRGLLCGVYERLDPSLLPPLYVAFSTGISEPTEIFHNNLRARYEQGEPAVVDAMKRFADLAFQARQAILDGDAATLARLIDENFDLRRSICRLPGNQTDMIERARAAGASAKFAGSGGAIIGTLPDEATFNRLTANLAPIGCRVIRLNLAAETPIK
ncbi:MAG: GHMP kinase [Planctomycetaceae bacterium]|nr:GHMP kinase [Planctomycetaceae bacterium]